MSEIQNTNCKIFTRKHVHGKVTFKTFVRSLFALYCVFTHSRPCTILSYVMSMMSYEFTSLYFNGRQKAHEKMYWE